MGLANATAGRRGLRAAPLLLVGRGLVATAPSGPSVDSVSPNTGPTAGGTAITVTGSGFVSGATVRLSGVFCTSVVVVNANTITCVTAAGTAGQKTCRVTNPDGQFGDKINAFTYAAVAPVPTLTSVSPGIVDTRGTTRTQIVGGTGFTGATLVTVGGVSVPFTFIHDGALQITSVPAHAAGSVSVEVTTPGGTNPANNALEYWDLGVDTPAQHFTRPDYAAAGGNGTWTARAGSNASHATFAPPATSGVPDFAASSHLLTVTSPLSAWAGVTGHHFVAVVEFDSMIGAAPAATTYTNPAIWKDSSQFIGLHTRVTAGVYYLDYYEWDGTAKVASWSLGATLPSGKLVVQCRKTGGNLQIKVGSGAWVTGDACGNTAGTSGNLVIGENADARVYALATYTGAKNDTFAGQAVAYGVAEYP